MNLFIKAFIVIVVLVPVSIVQARNPVSWTMKMNPISSSEAEVVFTASITSGWHIYDTITDGIGPVPTTFTFDSSSEYTLKGPMIEKIEPVSLYDSSFEATLRLYENKAIFVQPIQVHKRSAKVKAHVQFMVCNDRTCLPPVTVELRKRVKVK